MRAHCFGLDFGAFSIDFNENKFNIPIPHSPCPFHSNEFIPQNSPIDSVGPFWISPSFPYHSSPMENINNERNQPNLGYLLGKMTLPSLPLPLHFHFKHNLYFAFIFSPFYSKASESFKMVYGAANQLIKFMVFTANLLIFVFGGLLFGFSLWANLDKNFDAHLRDFAQKIHLDDRLVDEIARYQASLWILVAVGALLMVVGFLGCCGAACENFILLTLFAVCLIILFLIELFVLVSIFTNRGQLLGTLHDAFVKSSETMEGRMNLKPIETLLNCCGATVETKHIYAKEGLCPGELANAEDCYSAIASKIDTTALLICGIGLLLIQFFSILFSSALCSAFRERGPVYYA